MATLIVWTLIAIGAAALVLVVASAASGRTGGVRTFVHDLRAGLQEYRSRGSESPAANPEPAPVDTTLDEFFAAAQVDDDPYLRVDDLTDTLARARVLASRGVALVRR